MPDDPKLPDDAGDAEEREASEAEEQPDVEGDAAEGEAAEAESRPDAEGDAAESDASEAEAEGDAAGDATEGQASEAEAEGDREGDATESEASEAEAAETEGDEAERRAAEEEVSEAEAEDDEFAIDQKRMPFTHHLVELRFRILVCIGSVGAAFVLIFFVFDQELFWLMTVPLDRACRSKILIAKGVTFEGLMISHEPVGMLATAALFSLLASFALTLPIVFYQAWAFVAPGMTLRERKAAVPIMLIGTGLFLIGASFAYLAVLPAAVQFLLEYTVKFAGVRPLWTISKVIKFETVMMLVFGLAFELPLVVSALTRVGILTPEMLARKRRHAIVAMFVLGALLTPPDPFTQVCLAVPLVILLEVSIQVSRFFKPKHSIWQGWDDEPDGALGGEWDKAEAEMAAEGPASAHDDEAPPGDGSEDYGYEESYDDEYYDEYGEHYGEDTYEDSMGDDIDWSEEDEGGPADEFPDEDAPPDDDAQDDGEPTDEAPPAPETSDDGEPAGEDGPDEPKPPSP